MRTHITGHVHGRIDASALAEAVTAMTGRVPVVSVLEMDEDETKTVISVADGEAEGHTHVIRVFEARSTPRGSAASVSTCVVAPAGERTKLIVGRIIAIGGGLLIDERDGSAVTVPADR